MTVAPTASPPPPASSGQAPSATAAPVGSTAPSTAGTAAGTPATQTPPLRLSALTLDPALGVRRLGCLDVDRDDNLYVSDGSRVYRIDRSGRTETVAGSGPKRRTGLATKEDLDAQFYYAGGTAVDSRKNAYFCDSWNHTVIKRASDGTLTPFAGRWLGVGSDPGGYDAVDEGRAATQVRLNRPRDVVVGADDSVYIADSDNNRVRKVTTDGRISTVVMTADGDLGSAGVGLKSPWGLAMNTAGTTLYIADTQNHRVLKLDVASGKLSLVAGGTGNGDGGDGGPAAAAKLSYPRSVAVDGDGNLFIADTGNHRVRLVTSSTSGAVIRTIAGTGQTSNPTSGDRSDPTAVALVQPVAVACDSTGAVYIATFWDGPVWRVDRPSFSVPPHTKYGFGTAGFSVLAVVSPGLTAQATPDSALIGNLVSNSEPYQKDAGGWALSVVVDPSGLDKGRYVQVSLQDKGGTTQRTYFPLKDAALAGTLSGTVTGVPTSMAPTGFQHALVVTRAANGTVTLYLDGEPLPAAVSVKPASATSTTTSAAVTTTSAAATTTAAASATADVSNHGSLDMDRYLPLVTKDPKTTTGATASTGTTASTTEPSGLVRKVCLFSTALSATDARTVTRLVMNPRINAATTLAAQWNDTPSVTTPAAAPGKKPTHTPYEVALNGTLTFSSTEGTSSATITESGTLSDDASVTASKPNAIIRDEDDCHWDLYLAGGKKAGDELDLSPAARDYTWSWDEGWGLAQSYFYRDVDLTAIEAIGCVGAWHLRGRAPGGNRLGRDLSGLGNHVPQRQVVEASDLDAVLPFSIRTQVGDYWCWAATALSVATFYDRGKDATTQEAFVTDTAAGLAWSMWRHGPNRPTVLTTTPVKGGPWDRTNLVEHALNRLGVYAETVPRPDLKRARSEVREGRPVVLRLLWDGKESQGHYVVLSGVYVATANQKADPMVVISDPFNGVTTLPVGSAPSGSTLLTLFPKKQATWVDTIYTRPVQAAK